MNRFLPPVGHFGFAPHPLRTTVRASAVFGHMRYWWVNQNQTYRHEVQGGYLWSPKRNANGARNPFYEAMREVSPGDLVFSFVDTRIIAIGVAQSYCYESPKCPEFGSSGQNWENIGWRVGGAIICHDGLPGALPPRSALPPLLSGRSKPQPIQQEALSDRQIATRCRLAVTVRSARGVVAAGSRCGLWGASCSRAELNPVHLVASHCKPWRDAPNEERLEEPPLPTCEGADIQGSGRVDAHAQQRRTMGDRRDDEPTIVFESDEPAMCCAIKEMIDARGQEQVRSHRRFTATQCCYARTGRPRSDNLWKVGHAWASTRRSSRTPETETRSYSFRPSMSHAHTEEEA